MWKEKVKVFPNSGDGIQIWGGKGENLEKRKWEYFLILEIESTFEKRKWQYFLILEIESKFEKKSESIF